MIHHKFYKDWLQNSTSPLILNGCTLSRFTIFLLINIKILQVISIAHSYENLNKLGSVIDEIAGTVITHTKRERVCLFLFTIDDWECFLALRSHIYYRYLSSECFCLYLTTKVQQPKINQAEIQRTGYCGILVLVCSIVFCGLDYLLRLQWQMSLLHKTQKTTVKTIVLLQEGISCLWKNSFPECFQLLH